MKEYTYEVAAANLDQLDREIAAVLGADFSGLTRFGTTLIVHAQAPVDEAALESVIKNHIPDSTPPVVRLDLLRQKYSAPVNPALAGIQEISERLALLEDAVQQLKAAR